MKSWISLPLFALLFISHSVFAAYFSKSLCKDTDNYTCYVAKRGDTWAKLFTNDTEKDLVKRLNRMGNELFAGVPIAIPIKRNAAIMDFSPLPKHYQDIQSKTIVVSLNKLAWGAYNESGNLEQWGPTSSGKGYCKDTGVCNTAKGKYIIYNKGGKKCVSSKFPIGQGGAPMPYCMFYHKGFAIHGSYNIPGYNDSHGCVRVLVSDAEWLNTVFVKDTKVVTVIVSQD